MIYREATRSDVAAMREIYRPYVEGTTVSFEYETPSLVDFTARFERITRDFPWYVAEENGEIAGYAYADRAFERRAYCWDADLSVYISEKWHGRGIGRRFYALLEDALRRMGYVSAYALVTEENAASCAFHERMGYTLVGTFHDSGYKFDTWYDMVWMEKMIGPHKAPQQPVAFGCWTVD